MGLAVELLADCPSCRGEGTAQELFDAEQPCCRLGVPSEMRCRLCEASWQGVLVRREEGGDAVQGESGHCPACGTLLSDDAIDAHVCGACAARAEQELQQEPVDLRVADNLRRALDRLAEEEGLDDADAVLGDCFMGCSFEELREKLRSGSVVETSFDAMQALFGGGGGRAPAPAEDVPEAPAPREPPDAETAPNPSAIVWPLVSVLAADGHAHDSELSFLDRLLEAEGLPKVDQRAFEVHHPMEVGPHVKPEERLKVLELMAQLACVDAEVDPSELQVVHAYADAWGVSRRQVEQWVARYREHHSSDVQRFFTRIRSLLFSRKELDT